MKFSSIIKDDSPLLFDILSDIKGQEVYIGIPEEKTGRKRDPANNAQLMYIHTHGSELKGIPARAVIEPAIIADKEAISEELAASARAMMDSDKTDARRHLKLAGMTGQNASRAWFTDPRNGWEPNTRETSERKIRTIKGAAKKEAMEQLESGEAPESISRPLIDTGQLRKSIVYVVKGEK